MTSVADIEHQRRIDALERAEWLAQEEGVPPHLPRDPEMEAFEDEMRERDEVNNPPHYQGHPSGIECIQIAEHMNFCIGNAMKYLWRAGLKGDRKEDLMKAKWYINRELTRETE